MKYLIKQRTEELIIIWKFGVSPYNYSMIDFTRRIPRTFYDSLIKTEYHDNPTRPLYSDVDIIVGDYVDGYKVHSRNIVNGVPVLELSNNIKRTFLNTKEDVIKDIKDRCVSNKSRVIYHDILERMYYRANEDSNKCKFLPIEFLSKEENMYLNYIDIFYDVEYKTPLERFAKSMQFINYKCGEISKVII